MSRFVLELLDKSHDRKGFTCGLESIDDYLRKTARGHTEKGVSLTRVLVEVNAVAPKPILGYFALTPIMVEAAGWPEVPKGLPKNPVGAVLLGRMARGLRRATGGDRVDACLAVLGARDPRCALPQEVAHAQGQRRPVRAE